MFDILDFSIMKKLCSLIIIITFAFTLNSCEEEKIPGQVTAAEPDSVLNTPIEKDNLDFKETVEIKDTSVVTKKAKIKTSLGNIVIGLYGDEAPKTVENFIGLTKKRYYDGILIHRVARHFCIQMGDRLTKYKRRQSDWGSGGRSIYDGEFEDEINPETASYKTGYQKGVIAMANKGPNTNTSQFFICLEEAFLLEPEFTIFGRVLEGMEVVDSISKVEVNSSPRGLNDGLPVEPIKIYSIRTY